MLARRRPDGERILTWQQLYDLPALPEQLIVVGSGVTGAEFASAYLALGADVTLVSSRDRVLPGEDADAAEVIEGVFRRRGMTVLDRSRAQSVERTGDGVVVHLQDGRDRRGQPLPHGRRLGAQHGRPRAGGGRRRRSTESGHVAGRPRLADVGARRLRRGRLHRRAAARVRRRHAGPDRDVARAR